MVSGITWAGTCVLIGGAWTLGAAWRARSGRARTFLRSLAGGLVAVAGAAGLHAVLGAFGAGVAWEGLAVPGWSALAGALLVGGVEESAKLAGVALALTSRAPRPVARATIAVSALFAVAEAFLALEGGAWALALGRASLAPVAHGALAIPFAWALMRTPRAADRLGPSPAFELARIGVALVIAAALHGAGDWSLAQGGWGRFGFALTMAAPAAWLYWRLGRGAASRLRPGSVINRMRRSSATPQACAMQPRGV
jgi:hypothetical protein